MTAPRLLILLLLIPLATASALGGETAASADTLIISRAKDLLSRFDTSRDQAENEVYRRRMLAYADSLEAVGELAVASHCLERAGIICYYFGELRRAIEIWEHGLAVARRSGDDGRVAALLNAQAVGASASGDNELAISLYGDLLELRRRDGDRRGEGITWHNLAYSQIALFRIPEAVGSLRTALFLHREVGNIQGLATSFLALAPHLERYIRLEEAFAIADSAVARSEQTGNLQFLGVALSNRAEMLHRDGRLEEARSDLERAVAVLEKAGAERFLGPALMNLADVRLSSGEWTSGEGMARRALSLVEVHGDPAQPLQARAVLGRARMGNGDLRGARELLEEVVTDFEAMQDTLADAVSQAEASRAAAAVSYLALVHIAEGDAGAAWRVVERGLAPGLRRTLTGKFAAVALEPFQDLLADHGAAALVFGLPTMEGCPAFLITAHAVRPFVVAADGGVRRAHADVLADLAAGGEAEGLDAGLALLSSELVVPALGESPPDVTHFLIVPGGFAGLPFEALPLPDGLPFGERFAVTYAPSATAYVALEARPQARGDFLALSDPEPGSGMEAEAQIGPWRERLRSVVNQPLVEARAEVASIVPAGGKVFSGSEATATALRAAASSAAVIHVATHALADAANPDASALVLAPDAEGSLLLFAHEIDKLPLSADLVCLSGCRTAGGYIIAGEGAFGLTRSFIKAGARTVVASWWDVEDRASRRFMELFYAGLRADLDRAEAARRARVQMAAEGYGRHDRLAFAVVGAGSGSLADVLRRSRYSDLTAITVVTATMIAVGIAAALRRRRPTSPSLGERVPGAESCDA